MSNCYHSECATELLSITHSCPDETRSGGGCVFTMNLKEILKLEWWPIYVLRKQNICPITYHRNNENQ